MTALVPELASPVAGREPNDAAIRHLRAELDHLAAQLNGHLRRMQRTGKVPPPEHRFPGISIGDDELAARLADTLEPTELAGALEVVAEVAIEQTDRARREIGADPTLPLSRLRAAFGLSDKEMQLLLLSLAADFDPNMPRLFAYLHNHFERQYASFQILADALVSTAQATALRWMLDLEAPLVANALLKIDPKHEQVAVAHRALLAEARIVRFVQGYTGLDAKLGGLARLEAGHDLAQAPLVLQHQEDAALRAILRQATEREPETVWLLRGPTGVGKRTWSRAIAHARGLAHLRVDLVALGSEYGTLEAGLRVALREARLQNAMLCFENWSRLIEPARTEDVTRHDDGPRLDASRVLARVLGATSYSIISEDPVAVPPAGARAKVVDVRMPDLDASLALWKRYLPRDRAKAFGLTLKRLAQSFRLAPGHVQEAIVEAVSGLGPEEPISYEALSGAVKRQLRHRLGDNAKAVHAEYAWGDLVVSADVDLQMRELIGRWNSKSLVFDTWGLGKRFATGQGISVLFEGPPGTGKTMAASIIARELDLDLYQIDLSKVVNRYIGETEKNLGRIFDEAERSRVMLLFDEADSLFSSRTEVKSSNDRYANLEVNYLLQRVEHFTGIAVLTTNFPGALDEAFRRRIAMRVTFPKPQAAERQRLWESMLTNGAILAPGLDTEGLAHEFELAGGHIKNAVLRAAFIAANRGCRIDQDLLRIAARIELKEQGLLVHGSPYEELRARH